MLYTKWSQFTTYPGSQETKEVAGTQGMPWFVEYHQVGYNSQEFHHSRKASQLLLQATMTNLLYNYSADCERWLETRR